MKVLCWEGGALFAQWDKRGEFYRISVWDATDESGTPPDPPEGKVWVDAILREVVTIEGEEIQ